MGTKRNAIRNQAYNSRSNSESGRQNREARRISESILNGILNKMHKTYEIPSTPCRIIRIKKEDIPKQNTTSKPKETPPPKDPIPVQKPTSMSSLIIWNVSKALEMNPSMDLKSSIKATQQRLDDDLRDLNTMIAHPDNPEEQHLVCALLAWQQLGHHDADSLYRFIEFKRNDVFKECAESCMSKIYGKDTSQKSECEPAKATNVQCCHNPTVSGTTDIPADWSFGSYTSGPVVKLPVDTKFVMRLDSPPAPQQMPKRSQRGPVDTMNKIDAACCLDSGCVERLASLDATTKELRSRAAKLARREAERVELLERAEAAWKDLETGYQRRLLLSEEKEDDIKKQIQKMICDRNCFKNACLALAEQLKDRGDIVEKKREQLTEVEKQLCDRACVKLRLSEEVAKGEALLAEHQCKAAQYERDLQFKEEQARRKLITMQNEADSARALTHEAERAMRAELSGLREQIDQVSNELLEEDEANVRIKEEHEQLRQEKMEMIEDLDGCKTMCDLRMQARVDDLNKKKEALEALKEKAIECRCKMPVEKAVEVKRTPSLAALCRCAPEDKLLESCSCTSMRGRLLSNLLADLFGGLQTELSDSGSQMPCQLLKCLEDQHNWDRASIVKTNLRNFFSKLLVGELDIAIATSIENYHAKWVGESCADVAKMIPGPEDDLKEGWQQRALERRAQKMATELAEQLFQERAEQLAQRAKQIVTSGPPPCECKPPTAEAAVYSCLMPTSTPFGGVSAAIKQSGETSTPAYWKRTIQDVSKLRLQIEDLKKDSIKKADLKLMEDKITKIVKQASVIENDNITTVPKETCNIHVESNKNDIKNLKTVKEELPKTPNQNKSGVMRRKGLDTNNFARKASINEKPTKQSKKPTHGQSYAVNLCLCGIQKNSKSLQNTQLISDGKSSWKQKSFKDVIPENSIVKQAKPIINFLPSFEIEDDDSKISDLCDSNCKCFHKPPSCTSIDKLLETLTKWKCDLAAPQEQRIKNIKNSVSKYSKPKIKESMCISSSQNDSKINLSISTEINKNQVIRSNKKTRKENKKSRPAQYIQPVPTESEYMGAVNLDKSNEDVNCKCILNIQTKKENNQGKNNGKTNIPIKCINSNACECKIYQEMQKDNKNSQTEDQYNKVEIVNQFQVCHAQDATDLKHKKVSSKGINFVKDQKIINDLDNISQKKEIFPKNCEYYIKFLGVTLNDLNTHKNTKQIMKGDDNNAEDLLISKDKFIENRKKLQTNVESSSSFCKSKVITIDGNEQGLFNKSPKCECNAKFEKFKMYMNKFFTNELQDNTVTRKDKGLDSQSFKYVKNSLESCVCCNSLSVEDSKDIEVNAFHLLEEHLKGKLKEFKSYSCKSSCIPPEEEEKLFSAILQRVKQVISDCANEMKCTCPGGLPKDGSWNRAYGLLQEYLKIKIKRVQCLCVLSDKKEVILPDILDKVCNLIESDFERLKDICKCKNSYDARKKIVRIEDLDLSSMELPEKDTNNSISKRNLDIIGVQNLPVVSLSKQNSNKSIILRENNSAQVPPNLGMEAKSCDIMELIKKNVQTTETDTIDTDNKSNGVNKCDCCYNTDKRNFSDIIQFGTKEVLVNLYTDYELKNIDASCKVSSNNTEDESLKSLSADETNCIKPLPQENIKMNKSNIELQKKVDDEDNNRVPYIGYTVDCSCDGALGTCVCMKSIVQANNDKIDNIWKKMLASSSNCNQDFSYIMHSPQNKETGDFINHAVPQDVAVDDKPNASKQNDDKLVVETEVNVQNEGEIVLKNSATNVNTNHHTTNTFDENVSLGTSFTSETPVDWFGTPVTINSQGRSHTANLKNSIYFPVPIDDYKRSLLRDTVTSTSARKTSQSCECERVPICHVKMLVENIEKNLIESKCTCDSLISKVCPVHSHRHLN